MTLLQTAFKDVERKIGKEVDLQSLNRSIQWKLDASKKYKDSSLKVKKGEVKPVCPICEQPYYEELVEIYGFIYVQCQNKGCKHIFLRNHLIEEEVLDLYEGKIGKANAHHELYMNEDIFNKRVMDIATPKVEWVSEVVGIDGWWIDIGCATGEIIYAAKEIGYQSKGIDSDKQTTAFAERKGLQVICNFVDESNAKQYLDGAKIVSFFNILEHIEEPIKVLKTIVDNIAVGTYVVIEVPRHPSISSLNNIMYNDTVNRHMYPPNHVHIFTEQSLELMSKKLDLTALYVWTFGQDMYDLLTTSMAVQQPTGSKVFDEIIKKSNALQKSVDQEGLSDNMIVIFEKC